MRQKPGHLGDLSGGARELLEKMTLQIQRMAPLIKLGRGLGTGKLIMGSNRGCLHTRAPLLRKGLGLRGWKEHKVLLQGGIGVAEVFVGIRVWMSLRLLGRGRGEP